MRLSLVVRALASTLAFSAIASAANVVNVSSTAELLAAIQMAKAGDEIVLADGAYALTANVACSAAGTQAAPIVVRAATPFGAKIESKSVEGFVVTGASWRFEGLEIKGTCAADKDCEHAFHVSGDATDFVLRGDRIIDFNAQLKVNASTGPVRIPHRGLVEGCELFDTHPRDTGNPVTKLNIDTGDDWVVRANYIHDFHRRSGGTTYGAFMKSGGKRGIFERNLVLCTRDVASTSGDIGLSFGGGGTGNEFCAPAFDANVACTIEHDGGTMRNNVIASCSDVGIYVNEGKDSKLLHNTLIATGGVDFRYATSTGEARGNVVSGPIRDREGSTHREENNLEDVAQGTFDAMYEAPLVGNLKKKGDLAALLGKGPMLAAVPDDYCARTRSGAWDLGAIQHSLGDCPATLPPPGVPGATTPEGGAPNGGGGPGGPASSSSGDAGPNGSSNAAAVAGDDGCNAGGSRSAPLAAAVAFVLLALTRRRSRG